MIKRRNEQNLFAYSTKSSLVNVKPEVLTKIIE